MGLLKSIFAYLVFGLFRPAETGYVKQLMDFYQKSVEVHKNRNWKAIISFHLISVIFLLAALYILFLALADFDEIKTLAFCDVLKMYGVHKRLYLIVVLHVFLIIFYYEIDFNWMNEQIYNNVMKVLNGDNRGLFYCNLKIKNQPAIFKVQKSLRLLPKTCSVFAYSFGK